MEDYGNYMDYEDTDFEVEDELFDLPALYGFEGWDNPDDLETWGW